MNLSIIRIIIFAALSICLASTEDAKVEIQITVSQLKSNLPSTRELLLASPTVNAQVGLWIIHTVLWFVVCYVIGRPLFIKLINQMQSKDRFMKLQRQTMKKMIGLDIGDDDSAVEHLALPLACLLAHGCGGFLCFFSGCGLSSILPPGIASALARHGNMVEMGYESQDMLCRVLMCLFGPEINCKMNPLGLWVVLLFHHTASFCMVIPGNIYYPEYTPLHELSFLLQCAATIAAAVQTYGYTLDTAQPVGLKKMKISVVCVSVLFIWSRVIRYFWLGWIIGNRIWADGHMGLFKLFCVPLVCLSLFNMIIVIDCFYKLMKFLPMKIAEHPNEMIEEIASDAASAGVVTRQVSSYFELTKSQKEWAKVRGAVWMGAFCSNEHDTKETISKKEQ